MQNRCIKQLFLGSRAWRQSRSHSLRPPWPAVGKIDLTREVQNEIARVESTRTQTIVENVFKSNKFDNITNQRVYIVLNSHAAQ